MLFRRFIVFLLVGFLLSCGPVRRPTSLHFEDYSISASLPRDSAILGLVKPYRDSVWSQMNEVVGQVAERMEKRQPNCELGNFMADAMRERGAEKYGVPIDLAFVNYGGIRLNEITPGPITRGKVFELMPFDNLLLVQRLNGKTLKSLFDLLASRNGWPLSGGTYAIREGKAVDIRIGGKPLDESATYTVANSDFVINGGDNVWMLKEIPFQNNGYLVRDAILEYIRRLTAGGKMVTSPETRVSYAQ